MRLKLNAQHAQHSGGGGTCPRTVFSDPHFVLVQSEASNETSEGGLDRGRRWCRRWSTHPSQVEVQSRARVNQVIVVAPEAESVLHLISRR